MRGDYHKDYGDFTEEIGKVKPFEKKVLYDNYTATFFLDYDFKQHSPDRGDS